MNRSTRTSNHKGGRGGFTLLEITLSLAVLMMLIGGIYQVASAAFQVSGKVTEKGQQEMHIAAFFGLLRQNFGSMPGNAKIVMELENSVSDYGTEIELTDFPLAFAWGGVTAGSEKVLIVSEKDPLGGIQVRIRYLNEEEAESHDNGNLGADEGESIVLIAGIRKMWWRFYNSDPNAAPTGDPEEAWMLEWEETETKRPSLVELNIEFFSLKDPLRAVFWIPVVANPETVVRSAQRSQGAGGRRTSTQGGARTNPRIQPPGGGGTRPSSGGTRPSSGGTRPSSGGGGARPPRGGR